MQAKGDATKDKAAVEKDASHTIGKVGPYAVSSSGGISSDDPRRTQGSYDQTVGSAKEAVNMTPMPEMEQIPKKIRHNSSNFEVKLWIFGKLLSFDENLTRIEAWDRVKHFVGSGEATFKMKENLWIESYGPYVGSILFEIVADQRRDSDNENKATDVSNTYLSRTGLRF